MIMKKRVIGLSKNSIGIVINKPYSDMFDIKKNDEVEVIINKIIKEKK